MGLHRVLEHNPLSVNGFSGGGERRAEARRRSAFAGAGFQLPENIEVMGRSGRQEPNDRITPPAGP